MSRPHGSGAAGRTAPSQPRASGICSQPGQNAFKATQKEKKKGRMEKRWSLWMEENRVDLMDGKGDN